MYGAELMSTPDTCTYLLLLYITLVGATCVLDGKGVSSAVLAVEAF